MTGEPALRLILAQLDNVEDAAAAAALTAAGGVKVGLVCGKITFCLEEK